MKTRNDNLYGYAVLLDDDKLSISTYRIIKVDNKKQLELEKNHTFENKTEYFAEVKKKNYNDGHFFMKKCYIEKRPNIEVYNYVIDSSGEIIVDKNSVNIINSNNIDDMHEKEYELATKGILPANILFGLYDYLKNDEEKDYFRSR